MIKNTCLALALVIALFLTPLRGVPFGNGPPLTSPWEILFAALLVLTIVLTARLPMRQGRWIALILLALTLAGAKAAVFRYQLPHGLIGRYRVEPPGVGRKWELALHQRLPDATRIDAPIAFYNTGYRLGKAAFPFFFLNDWNRHPWVSRNSAMQPTVHIKWDGYLVVEEEGIWSFRMLTPDSCGLTLDGLELTPYSRGMKHCSREVKTELSKGLHPLEIKYAQHILDLNAPPPDSHLLFQWRRAEGPWETVPAAVLLPLEAAGEALDRDRNMRPLARALFWSQWVLLGLCLTAMLTEVPRGLWKGERGRLAFLALLLLGLAFALTLRDARSPSANYIWLGSDDVAYESMARTFILEDWVSTPSDGHEGKVAYSYFLAAAHLIFGESLVQIVLIQRFLVVAASFLIYWIGRSFFSPRVGLYALMLTAVSTQLTAWSRAIYPTSLGTFLVALALVCTLRVRKGASPAWLFGSGAALGLAIHARPNFLPFLLLVPLWLILAEKPMKRILASTGYFFVAAGFVEMLARLRSLAAYGKLFTAQGMVSINLIMGNPIPPGVDLSAVPKTAYLGLPSHFWAMWAFAKQKPLAFAALWSKKFLYLFGINTIGSLKNPRLFTYEIFFFVVLGLLGATIAIRRYGRKATWLPLTFVAANAAVMVVTTPDHHGYRLLVPMLPLLAIYVAVALETLDLSWPLAVHWKVNLIRAVLFLAVLPFRYGFQYGLIGLAYIWPDNRGKARMESLLRDLVALPLSTSPLTTREGSLK